MGDRRARDHRAPATDEASRRPPSRPSGSCRSRRSAPAFGRIVALFECGSHIGSPAVHEQKLARACTQRRSHYGTVRASHSRTAALTAPRSFLRPWSPGTTATSRRSPDGGIPNRSRSPCTTRVATPHVVQLGETTLRRTGAARWHERKGKAQHGGRAGRRRGATRHARARRPTANDQRELEQLAAAKTVDHRNPGRVELGGGRRGARPPDRAARPVRRSILRRTP